jgi:hypothetical protein
MKPEFKVGDEVIVKYDPVKKNASYYLGLKGKLSKKDYYGVVESYEDDPIHNYFAYHVSVPAANNKTADGYDIPVDIKPKNIVPCTSAECSKLVAEAKKVNPGFFKEFKSSFNSHNSRNSHNSQKRNNKGFGALACVTARNNVRRARNRGTQQNIAAAEHRLATVCPSGGSLRRTRRR